jgi:uncharacterized surface protein with fasciclin (FAS1) repeats
VRLPNPSTQSTERAKADSPILLKSSIFIPKKLKLCVRFSFGCRFVESPLIKKISVMKKILILTAMLSVVIPFSLSAHCGSCGVGDETVAHTHEKTTSVDIVDTAIAAGDFNTLAAAIEAAGLVETLKGDGPFTVFAPTDAAFAKLPEGTLESLLKPENKSKLAAILAYHVVPAKVEAKDVKTMKAPTVNGAEISITVKYGKVMVDEATVVKTDIMASNGVIHVIDSVILPPM